MEDASLAGALAVPELPLHLGADLGLEGVDVESLLSECPGRRTRARRGARAPGNARPRPAP